MTAEEFTARLKKHKLNKEQAAKILGVHFTTAYRWAKGTRTISKSTTKLINELLP